MTSPLIKVVDKPVWLAPCYFGSIQWYAALSMHAHAVVDTGLRYDKRRKSVHRCEIVDTRARLMLTVPVSRCKDRHCERWSQATVSPQAQWWSDHRVSLESAYGRTPYFEHYIHRFMPWLSSEATGMSIVELDRTLDEQVRCILQLDTQVSYADVPEAEAGSVNDWRRTLPDFTLVPYYQVRAHKFGFQPGLSILDLIFNMGPEAPLVLHGMTKKFPHNAY